MGMVKKFYNNIWIEADRSRDTWLFIGLAKRH